MTVPSRGCSAGDQIQDLVHITVCYIPTRMHGGDMGEHVFCNLERGGGKEGERKGEKE